MIAVLRVAAVAGLIVCGVGLVWYYKSGHVTPRAVTVAPVNENTWIDQLYTANPAEVEAATRQLHELGPRALPLIHQTFQDPGASTARVKAALKACAILGPVAASAIPEVAEQLPDPTLTAEAAVALSFMGRAAFGPLRDALSSDDPVVRREALRSIGKLKERAPLDARAVVPLLIKSVTDSDAGVRAVAVTYLGIIHEGGTEAVDALVTALKDQEVDVRRSAATALGSFGDAAAPAIPALRKVAADPDPEVAREAGVTLVKLQAK
ncbi:MAG: HEAT repeat domain-containing protein [Vicinamibacterales bacterium]